MSKPKIVLVSVAATAGVLGLVTASGWLLALRSVRRADFAPLSKLFEASVGGTIARGDVLLQPGKPRPAEAGGAIGFYATHPQALERDVSYFKTWRSAVAIASASLREARPVGPWQSSSSASWIAATSRLDSWGHAFCVRPGPAAAFVLSAGPRAIASLDCSTVKISEADLAKTRGGRLEPTASGALLLALRKKSPGL